MIMTVQKEQNIQQKGNAYEKTAFWETISPLDHFGYEFISADQSI